jgi:hypothetical protein
MSVQLRIVALPSGGVPAPRDSSMESVTRGYVMVSGVTWHYEKLCASRGLHRHPPSCRAGPLHRSLSISTRRAAPFSHRSAAVKRTDSDTSIGSFSHHGKGLEANGTVFAVSVATVSPWPSRNNWNCDPRLPHGGRQAAGAWSPRPPPLVLATAPSAYPVASRSHCRVSFHREK